MSMKLGIVVVYRAGEILKAWITLSKSENDKQHISKNKKHLRRKVFCIMRY